DIFGDTLFNARPAIAADLNKPGVIRTAYGVLDPQPGPDEKLLPRNFGRGPGQIMLNMRIGRTFAFGSSREGGAAVSAGASGGGGPRGTPTSPFAIQGGPAQSGGAPTNRRYSFTV